MGRKKERLCEVCCKIYIESYPNRPCPCGARRSVSYDRSKYAKGLYNSEQATQSRIESNEKAIANGLKELRRMVNEHA